ncbi:MAG TPA: hypothetical protein VGP07_07565 [Polyangia bacterium]
MKKASTLLVPVLLLGFSAAIAQSCASGETAPLSGGSGGDSGDGSGGDSGDGSGGSSTSSSGGKVGTGGATTNGSGGKVGSGGTTTTASGGATTTGSGGKVGTGGTTTTTGSGGAVVTTSTGGTTGTTTCTPQDATMTVANGMATNGTWSGYAYTYVGSTPATIMPDCSTSAAACFKTAAKQLCVSGTVGPDSTFGASAGFGWDIGGAATGTTKPAISPGGTGLAYNVPGVTTSMRFQVEDAAGVDYCAAVPTANTGTIPWGMFTQKCYNMPPGAAFAATTKITSVQVIVPTTSGSMAYPYCFCVVSIGPAT